MGTGASIPTSLPVGLNPKTHLSDYRKAKVVDGIQISNLAVLTFHSFELEIIQVQLNESKALDMSCRGLYGLPHQIAELNKIEHLRASSNYLTVFSSLFVNLNFDLL